MLLKHLCIQKMESERVIVGTKNTKTNSCMTLVSHRKSMLFSSEDKNDAMFWKQIV